VTINADLEVMALTFPLVAFRLPFVAFLLPSGDFLHVVVDSFFKTVALLFPFMDDVIVTLDGDF